MHVDLHVELHVIKIADLLILRPVSRDSPGSVSTGETPRQKISKVVAPRDTKVLFRKGNPWEALGIPLDTKKRRGAKA